MENFDNKMILDQTQSHAGLKREILKGNPHYQKQRDTRKEPEVHIRFQA